MGAGEKVRLGIAGEPNLPLPKRDRELRALTDEREFDIMILCEMIGNRPFRIGGSGMKLTSETERLIFRPFQPDDAEDIFYGRASDPIVKKTRNFKK
ncbi:MAG: hypothetical protein IJ060_10200 [Oscillospiraceae bacterium]|nr:hypothetical protein [Oscillospiraceae bacterium]